MTKQQIYEQLAADLLHVDHRDRALMNNNPSLWQQVRTIDDWLYDHRENPKLSVERFFNQCQKLRRIYGVPDAQPLPVEGRSAKFYGTKQWSIR